MENFTEEVQKHLEEQAHEKHDPSLTKIALTSAIIAVLAALASLLSEHQVNEALIGQLKASDQWSYYQAKGIKHHLVQTELDLLEAKGPVPSDQKAKLQDSLKKYEEDQRDISQEATAEQNASKKALHAHNRLSYSVTILQVAIGVSAVAALTRRRWLWYSSMGTAAAGLLLLIMGAVAAFS